MTKVMDLESTLLETPVKDLPFNGSDYGNELVDIIEQRLVHPLGITSISPLESLSSFYQRLQETLFKELEHLSENILSGTTNVGDVFKVKSLMGFDLENQSPAYLYGGNEDDVPLGSTGELVRILSDDRFIIDVGQEWSFHPNEVENTFTNRFTKMVDNYGGLLKMTQALIKEAKEQVLPKYLSPKTTSAPIRKDLFVSLPTLGLDGKEIVSFSVFTPGYERVMVSVHHRAKLSKINTRSRLNPTEEAIARQLVPRFRQDNQKEPQPKEISTPCSGLVRNPEELERHLAVIYQCSYANYFLCRKTHPGYPDFMCGLGAGNVFESLVSAGYHNTASANIAWRTVTHSYVTLPFFVKSTNQKILVGIDPTADQVESYGELFPPNFIFVVGEEDDFAYKITSRSKNRYFPEWVRVAKVIDQNTHRVLQTEGYEGEEFLKEAFGNPQSLTLTYGTLPPLL